MANIGYARVSTEDQHLDAQHAALANAGCTRVFSEKVTGTRRDRPELIRAVDHCHRGDVLVVARLDRVGRSIKHLIDTVTGLDERGVGFKSLYESIDTPAAPDA